MTVTAALLGAKPHEVSEQARQRSRCVAALRLEQEVVSRIVELALDSHQEAIKVTKHGSLSVADPFNVLCAHLGQDFIKREVDRRVHGDSCQAEWGSGCSVLPLSSLK